MTEEERKVLSAVTERLAVLEAEVAALKTGRYRELSLDERVRGATDGRWMLPRADTGGVLLVSDEERA